ncbi:MAG: BON domain-containing protein [Desulfobacteraceae bacterium]|nr:BON domain-containing protein [Desulfobacteraceae bacterium]
MTPDEQIRKQILDHLSWDARVHAAEVRVMCEGGRVVLAGSVPSHAGRWAAEQGAWGVPGVRMVHNRLAIRYPAEAEVPADDEIAINIRSKLLWNSDIDASNIEVAVAAGVATLEGTADSYWKKVKAEILAYDVIGVTQVENKLAVVPTRNIVDEAIGEDIVDALARSGAVDLEDIDVQVESGVVTLSGTVPDARALRIARDAAAHTAGVVDVKSELEIGKAEAKFYF